MQAVSIMNAPDAKHTGDQEISPAAISLRSWTVAELKVLHDYLF